MLNKKLVKYIKDNIFPLYSGIDTGHNVDFHIKRVIKECLELAIKLHNVNLNMIYVVAAYHDLGLLEDRGKHHIISKEMVLRDKNLLKWFNELEIKIIADAVEDHRASNNLMPRSIYGKIVADSDRIADLKELLISVYRTVNQKYPDLDKNNKEELFEKSYEWIISKNTKNGYIKYFINKEKEIKYQKMQEQTLNKEYIKNMYFKINGLK